MVMPYILIYVYKLKASMLLLLRMLEVRDTAIQKYSFAGRFAK